MLPEQKALIFKYFPGLVRGIDCARILEVLLKRGSISDETYDNFRLENNDYHNNRCILFKILDWNIFPEFVEALKETGATKLAAALENKLESFNRDANPNVLDVDINVTLSTQFYDSTQYNNTSFYSTRSKNRGHVLIINNINFLTEQSERHGAEMDELQLKELFEEMGFKIFINRNLTAEQMYLKSQEFAKDVVPLDQVPDIAVVIIMSHGVIFKNETMILSSDNKLVSEDHFRTIFNNENCLLFRKKPKIFIYHICRTIMTELRGGETKTDANFLPPQRTYSDMLICHPSVEGFTAHRNTKKGSWYLQMLCKVFMEHAHDMDVESMFKKVDEELEVVSSLPWPVENFNHRTEQTSTFQNIAFKRCYLHPGIYEQDGEIVHFK